MVELVDSFNNEMVPGELVYYWNKQGIFNFGVLTENFTLNNKDIVNKKPGFKYKTTKLLISKSN